MTHFNHGQSCVSSTLTSAWLRWWRGGGTKIAIFTGHTYNQIHLEEVLLFTITKLAIGMSNHMIVDTYFGGDHNRLSYGHPWMLHYLDDRYRNIVGHQVLLRFVQDFP